MEAQLEHIPRYTMHGYILYAQSVLITTKFLHRSSVGSLLRVRCRLGPQSTTTVLRSRIYVLHPQRPWLCCKVAASCRRRRRRRRERPRSRWCRRWAWPGAAPCCPATPPVRADPTPTRPHSSSGTRTRGTQYTGKRCFFLKKQHIQRFFWVGWVGVGWAGRGTAPTTCHTNNFDLFLNRGKKKEICSECTH